MGNGGKTPMNGTVGYWIRVILGSLDGGIQQAALVLLAGHNPEELAAGKVSISLNKNTLLLAALACGWAMWKNTRAYIKLPPLPNGAPATESKP